MDSQVWPPRACNGDTARSRLARGLSSREPGTGGELESQVSRLT